MKEFNLSEIRHRLENACTMLTRNELFREIEKQDKEFIKRLKKTQWRTNRDIDKLAGDKLTSPSAPKEKQK